MRVGVDDSGHHNERFHAVLASVLRVGARPTVPQFCPPDPALALVAFPLARLRQQFPQSRHLRHNQQGLSPTLQRNPLSQVRVSCLPYLILV